jgi:hypothetical protein
MKGDRFERWGVMRAVPFIGVNYFEIPRTIVMNLASEQRYLCQ